MRAEAASSLGPSGSIVVKGTGRAAIRTFTESQARFTESQTHTTERLRHRYFTQIQRGQKGCMGATLPGVGKSSGLTRGEAGGHDGDRERRDENRKLTLFEWLEC